MVLFSALITINFEVNVSLIIKAQANISVGVHNKINLICRKMSYITRYSIYEWSALDSNVSRLHASLLEHPDLVNTPNEVIILNMRMISNIRFLTF